MTEDRRIDRVRLDPIAKFNPSASPQVGAEKEAGEKTAEALKFGQLLQALYRDRKDTSGETTLRELLAGFVTPAVTDAAILSGDRAIALLEQLLLETLPQLDEGDEFRELAVAAINNEIEQRRRLRNRRRRDATT